MITNIQHTLKIPLLRFPEFIGEWEEKKLGKISERVVQKNKEGNSNILTISAQDGLISQEQYFNKIVAAKDTSGYYLIKKGDFAYNKSYSKGYPLGAIKKLRKYEKGVVSTLYICFRFSNEVGVDLMEQYFNSQRQNHQISMIAQEGARNHGLLNIGVQDFFGISIVLPQLSEQQKIADFLSMIDFRIANLKSKEKALEEYKTGMMQKIFSQEMRFKDENGEDFEDWEEKRLREVCEFIRNGLSGSQLSEKTDCLVTRIETISDGNINLSKIGYISKQDAKKDYILKSGDILFSNINSVKHIGKVAYSNGYENLFHGMNLLCIRGNNEIINSRFLFIVLRLQKSKQRFETICNQAVSQASINQTELSKFSFQLPSLPEQQKIANFLSGIDEKIENENERIERAEEWKKGLLQKMFV